MATLLSTIGRAAPWTNVYDPFVAMSFIAAHTSAHRCGRVGADHALPQPDRHRQALATLDRMSQGRLTIGVGAGWNEAEFAALGVPFHKRGARTNEYLRVWQACWSPGRVSFAGKFVEFSDMHVSPKPLQQPHPAIWIGGASDAALRRAARFAAVWQPTPISVADLVERKAALQEASRKIGREQPPQTRMSFRVDFSGTAPSEVAAELSRYREAAGVDAFQIDFHGNRDLDALLSSMERFMREVKPQVA